MKQNGQIGSSDRFRRVPFLGVSIADAPVDELIQWMAQTASAGRRAVVANVNVHGMNMAHEDLAFARFVKAADVVFCDGHGVRLGAYLAGKRLAHRYTPPDWIGQLASTCAREGLSMFFLGAQDGVAAEAAQRLRRLHPSLEIAGTHHGHFDKQAGSGENDDVVRAINTVRPNILLVGFGMPLQERWLQENFDSLKVNVALTVGALFDYMAGRVYRAPRWVTDVGAEWLARLIIEPRRLWKRYLIGNPRFVWRALRSRWTDGPPIG